MLANAPFLPVTGSKAVKINLLSNLSLNTQGDCSTAGQRKRGPARILPGDVPATATRERNARYLSESLSEVPGISPLPHDPRVSRYARHLLIVRYEPQYSYPDSRYRRPRGRLSGFHGGLVPLHLGSRTKKSTEALGRLIPIPARNWILTEIT